MEEKGRDGLRRGRGQEGVYEWKEGGREGREGGRKGQMD